MNKIILLLLTIGMISCSKSGQDELEVDNTLTITDVSKSSGEGNTEITISGTNFGLDPNSIQVYFNNKKAVFTICLLYTSPSPRDRQKSRMPSSA